MTVADTRIALTGIAFELPGCSNWAEAIDIFREGRDLVRPMPKERAATTRVRIPDNAREGGWLDDIAGFDHRYFGLSRTEAELIDPRQRRMLRLAVQAVSNAGYAPAELRGGRVGVFVAANGGPQPCLYDLLDPADRNNGLAFSGSLQALAAGRVAYHLDLCGAVLSVDTACSSFLAALHQARAALAHGECEAALVGGCEMVLGPVPHRQDAGEGLGVDSPTDRSRSFDEAADGVGFGEGGGFVLLKRLADAERDGDHIHAVILGSAMNSDAARSNGITAPSPVAQADVIRQAWQDAGVDPRSLGYVEAHGTGTRIGDPIEVQGLTDALAGRSTELPVSSVKANFGHLAALAGLSGLVRILAQFRAGELFPTAHFSRPNPLLGLEGSPVRVVAERTSWPATHGPRRAGISGFGLSGTNVHLVVEEGPRTAPALGRAATARPVVLSAHDETGLRTQLHELRSLVAADPHGFDIEAAGAVLAWGREHFPHRWAAAAVDGPELLQQLDSALRMPLPPREGLCVALVLGGTGTSGLAELEALAEVYAGFARVLTEAREIARQTGRQPGATAHWTPAELAVLHGAGSAAALADLGVPVTTLLAHGAGSAAARWARGESSLRDALDAAQERERSAAPVDGDTLRTALQAMDGEPLLVAAGTGSALHTAIAPPAQPTDFTRSVARLHLHGHTLDWTRGLAGPPQRRLELPAAPFQEAPCWPRTREEGEASGPVASAQPQPEHGPVGVADLVLSVAREVLGEQHFAPDDDFFDFGGNSINGTQLVTRLNARLGTALEVLDLFDRPTVGEFADFVADSAPEAASPAQAPTATDMQATETTRAAGTGRSARTRAALSGQQTAIWAAERLAPDSAAYTVPVVLELVDPADPEDLAVRLGRIRRRHPMLRCSLRETADGTVEQVVHDAEPGPVRLERHTSRAADEDALTQEICALVRVPLDPYGRPPARYHLLTVTGAGRPRQILVLLFHHLFFDGWSWQILLEDLGRDADLPASDRSYLDYAEEQRALLAGPRRAELSAFWADYLSGVRPMELPRDSASDERDASALAGASLPLSIGQDTLAGLRELAAGERVTLHMLLLAAWSALLWKVTAARDICVATPVAGRGPEDEDILGCFVNTLLVRVELRPQEPFSALLRTVRESSLRAQAHRYLPTDQVLRLAGLAGQTAADTMFDFQSGFHPLRRIGADGPAVKLLEIEPDGAKFALNLGWVEYGDELQAALEFSTALFREDTVRQWLDDYRGILERIARGGFTGDLFELLDSPTAPRAGTRLPDFTF
ncbi:condensation domain-containing protein [Streptomyces sp. NPDC014872]|uniref:condensation domain-containing protein n=1 Tax=Streptomyces sp. NPDC014872 TaxID=3364926 RepID=UPI0036F7446A